MHDLMTAKNNFADGRCTFVMVNRGSILTSSERGIMPMFKAVTENIIETNGASVADKIIGKAAVLLAIYGGVKNIFASTTTFTAVDICKEYNIYIEYNNIVVAIKNRDQTGNCPMEKLSEGVTQPEEMVDKVSKFLLQD